MRRVRHSHDQWVPYSSGEYHVCAFSDQVRRYVIENGEVEVSDDQIRQAARLLSPVIDRIEVPAPQYV
jgi:hypothetical protein